MWAVSLVKNEADIIVPVVEHLLRQGVEGVLVADNGSTDETAALLRLQAQRHPVHLAHDREPAYYQALKMDLLADWARRSGADWVIPFDADEFWYAPAVPVGEYLRNCHARKIEAAMYNLFPVAGTEFGQGPWLLETTPHDAVKVAFRSHRFAMLWEGNHGVHRPGRWSSGLRVLHVPWRSYEQFRNKGLQGLNAVSRTTHDNLMAYHWRMLGALEDEAAREVWERIVNGQPVDGLDWSPRRPVRLADPLKWRVWDPDGILTSDETALL